MDPIIKKCIEKDGRAQEELYNKYRKKLFLICLKYTSSETEAEDHLHDTFIEIFEKISKYKGKGSFEGWMKRIAINKAIDKYKRKKVFGLADHTLENLTEEVYLDFENPEVPIDKLMVFIQELPEKYRLIFNLYELDGYSHREISKKVGISENTSKSNLFRAKVNLKKRISAYRITIVKKQRRGE